MCPTITVGSFFRLESSTFLFICSTTSNLNNFKPQKRVQNEKKNKIDVHNLENTLKIPPKPHFFSALWDFFWSFLDCTRGSPFHLFRYFATQWMSKNRKGSPLLHFSALWHCSKISFEKFFGKFFHVSKGSLFNFLKIFCNQLEFHQARRVLLLNFEP